MLDWFVVFYLVRPDPRVRICRLYVLLTLLFSLLSCVIIMGYLCCVFTLAYSSFVVVCAWLVHVQIDGDLDEFWLSNAINALF